MRLGIDFGTTRIVVAFADRGNYPVVSFDVPDGSSSEWYPPLVAVKGDERRYGWEAWALQAEPGWTVFRSIKRALEDAGPQTRLQLVNQTVPVLDLLVELASSLKANLLERSALPASRAEPLEIMLGVPAHANSNQRYLTAESFRQAGFSVLGLLNEPSAASIEFGHRQNAGRKSGAGSGGKQRLLVYDLGGGTFDASLVELDDTHHRVIASEGISTLGGDDFDGVLAELALDAAAVSADERDDLTAAEWFHLHEECRQKKEALHPNTRRLAVDLSQVRGGWPEVSVSAADFYERCRPLVDETVHAVEDILAANGYAESGAPAESSGASAPMLEALYVTGGGSELPLVGRALKEVFGRRVRRSSYTRSATAIGLAIQSDAQAGYRLRDQFTRYFGVWREAEGGREVTFDPLFPKGTPLPGAGDPPVESARRYFPVHNVGHFRYLECSHLTDEGRPAGDITIWDEIRFPFDPALEPVRDLSSVEVMHLNPESRLEAEERYAGDSSGAVTVTISNLTAGYSRNYRLGRWSAAETAVVATPKRAKAKKPSASARGSKK